MTTFTDPMEAALAKVGGVKVDPLLQLFRNLCSEKNFLFGSNFDADDRESLAQTLYVRATEEMNLGFYWMLIQRYELNNGEETELDFVDVYKSEQLALENAGHTAVVNGDSLIIDLHERKLWWLDVKVVRDLQYILDED